MRRRDEQIKLIATGLANVGTAALIGGLVAPVFGGRLGPGTIFFAMLYGLGFHSLAHVALSFLKED